MSAQDGEWDRLRTSGFIPAIPCFISVITRSVTEEQLDPRSPI